MVAGGLDFMYTRASWERSISEQQVELGTKVIGEVDRFLYERLFDIQAIGEDDIFEKLLEERFVFPEVKDRIGELANFSGPWEALFLVNSDGVIVASTIEEEVGKRVEEEPNGDEAFRQLNSTKNNVYYSDVVMSDDTGKPIIMFAAPVKDKHTSGQPVIGVIIGSLPWRSVQDTLGNVETKIELNLYTKEGKLIATNQELPEKLFIVEPKVTLVIQEVLKEGRTMTDTGPGVEEEGEQELRAFVPSSGYLGYRGNNWVLLAEMPIESVFAPARQQAARGVLLLATGFVIALGIALWLLGRSVIFPITSLTGLAKAVAGGDLSTRIKVQSGDEIGQLGQAFNQMAARLQEYYDSLEQKVKERTAESEEARKQLEVVNLEMQKKLEEMERMNKLMVGRELKMVEMKKELEELKQVLAKSSAGPAQDGKNL